MSGLMLFRQFSTSVRLQGKRNFIKFSIGNKRFTRAEKEEMRHHKIKELFRENGVREVGYTTQRKDGSDEFHLIPQMVPDIIVPDLTGFTLKPYVSYRTADVVHPAFTAQDLFDSMYSKKIHEDYKANKLTEDGSPLEPSAHEKLQREEARNEALKTGTDLFCERK